MKKCNESCRESNNKVKFDSDNILIKDRTF